ncbi:SprT family zinc-dependent metalloprotease [uncultured Paracoccus sp.]|uniref:M48 family metallopeptidase n=1 Tax=uncultured Paracoccus sp. TaxID=189685 RepID=UPI002616853E|nr:SprT family zinc-dependent metalloprotease [uncultured Paracoccus sp.]
MTGGDAAIIVVDGDIPVTLRRHARARRMTLRVSRSDGGVVLTMPLRADPAAARAFAVSRAGWLRQTRSAMPVPRTVVPGSALPVEGRDRIVTPGPVRTVALDADVLMVPDHRPVGPLLEAWLKHRARDRLAAACDRHVAVLGRGFAAITLRDTRSRWGSCTHDGRLMFSWRLAMAPPAVLDYVAAHEVAHLAHMDHSPRFWGEVERLLPEHAAHRAWLRRHGGDLLCWRFRD